MSGEGEPSRKRAKVDEGDVIDLTGDDDSPAAAEPSKRHKEDAPPAPSPPSAATTSAQKTTADSSPAPECPPLHLLRVRGIADAFNVGFLGASLSDLVSGPITWAMISNFMIDGTWLASACPTLASVPEIVVVHGQDRGGGSSGAALIRQGLPRAVIHAPPVPQYGTHHSKFFLLYYKDRGMRVIVHTANLLYCDCNNKTQALWFQDFGLKDAGSPENSVFESDLKDYVRKLGLPRAAASRALELISLHDFSPARVHLIGSVPSGNGEFAGNEMTSWGHLKLRRVLNAEPFDPKFKGAPIIAQYSSVGSLSAKWFQAFVDSLSAGRVRGGNGNGVLGPPRRGLNDVHLVWPATQEVQGSLEGWFAGGSIPGNHKNVNQSFLLERYCVFGGAVVGRERAMPHIKSYLRFLGDEIAYMCIAAHNLSKPAWGEEQNSSKYRCQLFNVRSYELGVLLVPSLELNYRMSRWYGFSCTDLTRNGAPMAGAEGASSVRFVQWQQGRPQEASVADGVITVPLPVPYELAPRKYGPTDEPWCVGMPKYGLDALGKPWPGVGTHYGIPDQIDWRDVVEQLDG